MALSDHAAEINIVESVRSGKPFVTAQDCAGVRVLPRTLPTAQCSRKCGSVQTLWHAAPELSTAAAPLLAAWEPTQRKFVHVPELSLHFAVHISTKSS